MGGFGICVLHQMEMKISPIENRGVESSYINLPSLHLLIHYLASLTEALQLLCSS